MHVFKLKLTDMLLQRKSGGFQESGSIFRRSGSILKKQKVSEEVKGFLRRPFALYVRRFLKNGAVSLKDLREFRLTLPELHSGRFVCGTVTEILLHYF